MKFFQEVTDNWVGNIPNHVYLLNDSKDKMWGYVPDNQTELQLFSEPIQFDSRRRKFKVVPNIWKWQEPELKITTDSWQIKSKSGSVYTISRESQGLSCSCPGFKFRGKCRHLEDQHETV